MEQYQALERDLKGWAEQPYLAVCSSGTAALHLALESLPIPKGSPVFIPSYTFIACARAVTLAGLKPILVDCRPDNLLMDETLVELYLGADDNIVLDSVDDDDPRSYSVKGIMPVHVYGRRCRMEEIARIGRIFFLQTLEDMAEAHGVSVHPESAAAAWSFYANKIVAGEEGGAVAFRHSKHVEAARALRSLGTDPLLSGQYTHFARGHNYRLANSLASLIRKSLSLYSSEMRRRREAEAILDSHCPDSWKMPNRDSPWVYDLRLPGLKRSQHATILHDLWDLGIEARSSFLPLHRQEEYRSCLLLKREGPSQADRAADEVLWLPLRGPLGWPSDVSAKEAFERIDRHR